MYEFSQILVKIIIIFATLLVAGIICARVWRADLDLSKLFSPRRMIEQSVNPQMKWLPTREVNAIYQSGGIVAHVSGVRLDEPNRKIFFDEVYNSNTLDLQTEFEFQKWRLKFIGAETIIGLNSSMPQKGRIIEKAICEVIGTRNTF